METPPMTPQKSSKGLRIALALSLALNLAVVGVVAGAFLRGGPMLRDAMMRDPGFGPYPEALSPEDRKALRRALFDKAPEIRESRKLMRGEAREIIALLRAEPFDKKRFSELMMGQGDRVAAQLRLGQDLLRERVLAMSVSERQAFADRLEKGQRHRKDHDDKPDKPQD